MTIFTKGRQRVLIRFHGVNLFVDCAESHNRIATFESEIVDFTSQTYLDDYQCRHDSLGDRYIVEDEALEKKVKELTTI